MSGIHNISTSGSACGNCNMELEESRKISILINENEEIAVWNIVAYIYRMDGTCWENFKCNLQDVFMDSLTESCFGMCESCMTLLTDTFKALRQFENVTHAASVTHRVQSYYGKKLLAPSKSKSVDEDLFDSFNYEEEEKLVVEEPEEFLTLENKCSTVIEKDPLSNLLDNNNCEESLLFETPVPKVSIRSLKQLIINVEKLSESDLKKCKMNKLRNSSGELPLKIKKIETDQGLQIERALKSQRSLKRRKRKQPLAPEEKREYVCTICGKRFQNRAHMVRHMPTHFQEKNCKLCGKQLKSFRCLQIHMKLTHKLGNKNQLEKLIKTCEICGKTMNSNYMKRHMATHAYRESRQVFKCDKCDKEYLSKYPYEEHLLTHTENFTPYLCRVCGKTFHDKWNLYQHEKHHTKEKVPCPICSKMFRDNGTLTRHLLIHSEEKTFVCDVCGAAYKQKSDFHKHKKIHQEVSEKGEYSAKCKDCGRLFKHSEALRRHIQIHVKKFECSFCGKILSKSLNLKKHEDLHRSNPDYQPRKCKTWKSDIPFQVVSIADTKNRKK